MREIRMSGSEGGGPGINRPFLPLSRPRHHQKGHYRNGCPRKKGQSGVKKRGTALERNVPLGLLKQQFQGKLNLP